MFTNQEDVSIYNNFKTSLDKNYNHLLSELQTIRAGRANPHLVDKVMVDFYGTLTPLNQMATITTPDPRTIAINLWDNSMLREVLKAIAASDLGLNPSDDGKVIRLFVPAPTEERRLELVKTIKKFAEDTKINMRNGRRDALDQFKELKKESKITEDDLKLAEKEVQKILDTWTQKVDSAISQKEKEIMEI